jgi:hypothetical protein
MEKLIGGNVKTDTKKNTIKCRWCEYTCYRFKGKKSGGKLLWLHIVDTHEQEYLDSVGFKGTMIEYLDSVEDRENEDYLP